MGPLNYQNLYGRNRSCEVPIQGVCLSVGLSLGKSTLFWPVGCLLCPSGSCVVVPWIGFGTPLVRQRKICRQSFEFGRSDAYIMPMLLCPFCCLVYCCLACCQTLLSLLTLLEYQLDNKVGLLHCEYFAIASGKAGSAITPHLSLIHI